MNSRSIYEFKLSNSELQSRQTDRHQVRQRDIKTDRPTERQRDIKSERHKDRDIKVRQKDRQTSSQTDRH